MSNQRRQSSLSVCSIHSQVVKDFTSYKLVTTDVQYINTLKRLIYLHNFTGIV